MSLLPVAEICSVCGEPKGMGSDCMWCAMRRNATAPPPPVAPDFVGDFAESCQRWAWGQDRRSRCRMLDELLVLVRNIVNPLKTRITMLIVERDAARKQAEKFDAALNSIIARRVTPAEKAVLDFVNECNSFDGIEEFKTRVAAYRKERSEAEIHFSGVPPVLIELPDKRTATETAMSVKAANARLGVRDDREFIAGGME